MNGDAAEARARSLPTRARGGSRLCQRPEPLQTNPVPTPHRIVAGGGLETVADNTVQSSRGKLVLASKTACSANRPASLLQAPHRSHVGDVKVDVRRVGLLPPTTTRAQTNLSCSAHAPSAFGASRTAGDVTLYFTARRTAAPAQARVRGWISCRLTRQQNYLPRCDFESHSSSDVLEAYGTGQSCPELQTLLLLFMSAAVALKS